VEPEPPYAVKSSCNDDCRLTNGDWLTRIAFEQSSATERLFVIRQSAFVNFRLGRVTLVTMSTSRGTGLPERLMPPPCGARLSEEEVTQLWTAIHAAVLRYGFSITFEQLEAPRIGIFDGLRIVIDPRVSSEMRCFLLLHLFGHSVQWVAPSLAASVEPIRSSADRDRFLAALKIYEFEAARFGLQVLHEANVLTLDAWYSDFVESDWRYVEGYYATGSLPAWSDCVVAGCPLIVPAPIPPLHHRQVDVRFAF
jgi:hypothetical protein